MSYLVQTGNLASVPALKTSQAGKPWCEARIIHTDRERSRDGSWRTISTIAYTVRVYTAGRRNSWSRRQPPTATSTCCSPAATPSAPRPAKDGITATACEVDTDDIAISLGQEIQ